YDKGRRQPQRARRLPCMRTARILNEPMATRSALQGDEARACAPTVERSEVRWTAVVASGPLGRGADGNGEDEWFCIQPLCFGYFHFGAANESNSPAGARPGKGGMNQ